MRSYIFWIAIVVCTSAKAQDKSLDTTARYFLIQASIGNLQEIAIGKLAAQHATRPEVKAFANRMVTDHTNAQAQLMQLLKTKGMELPREATQPPVEDLMLKKVAPAEFDQIYVHMMVPDHRQTVDLFQNYAWTGKDPLVKTFAQQALPVLKEHLAAIKSIDENMTATATK